MIPVYVLSRDDTLVGVYSTHRKANQTMIMDTLRGGFKLKEYCFEFDIEYFTYVTDDDKQSVWTIQETEMDARA